MNDFVQRFIFDKLPLHGAFVVLEDVWQKIATQRVYPSGVKQVLGELLVANVLLATNLKNYNKIAAQIQNNSALDFVITECTEELSVRATAKFNKSVASDCQPSYKDCLSSGSLIICVDTEKSSKVYKSVVLLSHDKLSDVLDGYMLQSEQILSMFIFSYTDNKIVGFMLQQLPDHASSFEEEVKLLFWLASTLNKNEMQNTAINELLRRVFNEHDIILLNAQRIKFGCKCSREKVANMLRILGIAEAEHIIAVDGHIKINCDFCNASYAFAKNDVMSIFSTLGVDIDAVYPNIH